MLPVQHPADARLVAHSCPGLGSFVGVDVFVVDIVFVVDNVVWGCMRGPKH